jgi:hypothetical protein
MACYYYLLDLSSNPQGRLAAVTNRLRAGQGGRVEPWQIGHTRMSLDGTQAIVQGQPTGTEHGQIMGAWWVELLGEFDPATGRADDAVYAYLAANRAAWNPAMPVTLERPVGAAAALAGAGAGGAGGVA